jgi:hypothetical protein
MTSLVAWVGVDDRGPASLNMASDSRISWRSQKLWWDAGRKLFASTAQPDIFGFVGMLEFPSLVLCQIVSSLDNGLYSQATEIEERVHLLNEQIKCSFSGYPKPLVSKFNIIHGYRQGEGMTCKFSLSVISWSLENGWELTRLTIPDRSSALWIDGSGNKSVEKWYSRWGSSSQKDTSRSVYSAFCNTLHGKTDTYTGGGPQLVSLYRKKPGRTSGCFFDGISFVYGMPFDKNMSNVEFEFRNEFFERCDIDGKLLENAQKHHVPNGLK